MAALIVPVLLVGGLGWLFFGDYEGVMLALDRASALGPCHRGDGVLPLCDFANHYYPQGRLLAVRPAAMPGFYYGGCFAVGMRLLALLPFAPARVLWATVVGAAALTLLLAPPGLRRSFAGSVRYGLLFAISLPVWHDLAFGQVSSLLTALVVLSFLAYGRGHRSLAAVILGLAASIKFYPAFFAVYFLLRKDRRTVLVFLGSLLAFAAGLPAAVLGEAGFLAFYGSLWANLQQIASTAAASPFGNYVANAVAHLFHGRVDPDSLLYRAAMVAGLGVAVGHGLLAGRLARADADRSVRPALMLGLATIPFVVRPAWVHYFVFLPLLWGFVLEPVPHARRLTRCLPAVAVGVSAMLVSVPLLLLVGGDGYYQAGAPFWATAMVLPALYLRVLGELRFPSPSGVEPPQARASLCEPR